MTANQEIEPRGIDPSVPILGADKRLKFAGNNDFHVEVRRRIDEFFRTTRLPQRDCPQMYLKTAVLLAVFAASYWLLVFMAQTWWQALPLAVLLGLTTAAITPIPITPGSTS